MRCAYSRNKSAHIGAGFAAKSRELLLEDRARSCLKRTLDSAQFFSDTHRTRLTGIGKGLATCIANPLIYLAPRPGLEPGTYGLTVRRSTN
jgi:hypothetical protein